MRALLLAALLPALASAQQESLTETQRNVIVGGIGVAVGTYATVSTFFMLDQLLKQGWAEPKYTVPAGFLAGVSLVASIAGVAVWARDRNEIGIVGGGLAAVSSAVMCFFVTLAVHGWAIRAPPSALPEEVR